jgi:hypothetical protein
MTTNGRTRHRNGTKSEDPVDSFYDLGEEIQGSFEAAMERAIDQSIALARFTSSGAADIEVRREGLTRRENAEDRKRKDALKRNRDRGKLTADHTKLLGDYAVNAQQYVLDVVEHMTEDIANRPAAVQSVGEMLTKGSAKILTANYLQSLQFIAERGFQTIDQATPPGQQ